MPVAASEVPDGLRAYQFHGLALEWKEGDTHAIGDCPFCSKEGKFSVEIASGMYRCFTCAEGTKKGGGNSYVFIRKLHEKSMENTKLSEYEPLRVDRGLLKSETLREWGVCKSITTREWIVPGYDTKGKISNLYRYREVKGKRVMLGTPLMSQGLFGLQHWDHEKPNAKLNEGCWDGMALWEMLRLVKVDNGKLIQTGNEAKSVYSDTNVVAVPGCTTFMDSWIPLFEGKNTDILFDNDHPRKHEQTGKTVAPAGLLGARRTTGLLYSDKTPPNEVRYLKWGDGVFDVDLKGFNPNLANGYDVRDQLSSPNLSTRINRLSALLENLTEVPDSWKYGEKKKEQQQKIRCIPCQSFADLERAWEKAMYWTQGLSRGLIISLATVASTPLLDDQLWCKIISPPSSGKTSIADAIGIADKYVKMKDTIRGFTSGYLDPSGESTDLATELDGYCLITADGDTFIKSPNLSNINSEARRLYDGTLNSHFKNKTGKDTSGHRMTWLLYGTSALRSIDQSELGARFLDFVMMNRIDVSVEKKISREGVDSMLSNMAVESSKKGDGRTSKKMALAMGLTGGYVNYLRENAADFVSEIEVSDEVKDRCVALGTFVAYMRSRPSSLQEEISEREMSIRLSKQLMRLSVMNAVTINKNVVDNEVMDITESVAMDTARGHILQLTEKMLQFPKGVTLQQLSSVLSKSDDFTRRLMIFMKHIGASYWYDPKKSGVHQSRLFCLTEHMKNLCKEVYGESRVEAMTKPSANGHAKTVTKKTTAKKPISKIRKVKK